MFWRLCLYVMHEEVSDVFHRPFAQKSCFLVLFKTQRRQEIVGRRSNDRNVLYVVVCFADFQLLRIQTQKKTSIIKLHRSRRCTRRDVRSVSYGLNIECTRLDVDVCQILPRIWKKYSKTILHTFLLTGFVKKFFMRQGFSRVAICPSRTKHVYVIARYGL